MQLNSKQISVARKFEGGIVHQPGSIDNYDGFKLTPVSKIEITEKLIAYIVNSLQRTCFNSRMCKLSRKRNT